MGATQHTVDPSSRKRQIVEGGPWLFWSEAAEAAPQAVIWQITPHCKTKACPCREIEIVATRVDGLLSAYSEEGGRLHLWFQDGPGVREQKPPSFLGRVGSWLQGAPAEQPDAHKLRVRIDFRVGAAEVAPGARKDEQAEDLLPGVRRELDGDALDALYDEFRRAQGYLVMTTPRLGEWRATWQSGMMVGWLEAFPDAREDLYVVRGMTYKARDFHCVRPGCSCNTLRIYFNRMAGPPPYPIAGSVKVWVDSGKAVKFEASTIADAIVRELWEAFRTRHRLPAVLQERSARLLEDLGPQLYGVPAAPKAPPSSAKVSRNAPCPCGSARKFKLCCGATA